jgi:hypothetical protein
MGSRVTIVGAVLVTIVGIGGCTSSEQTSSSGSSTSLSTSSSDNSDAGCAAPHIAQITSPESENAKPPSTLPQAVALRSLLLTVLDLPPGYSTSPSVIMGTHGDFNAVAQLPELVAYVDFNDTGNPSSYHELVYFGLGVSEMIGKTTSARSAVRIAQRMRLLSRRCNPGTPVELPGTVPKLVADVYSGELGDSHFSYAATYVTKGSYVAQLTWGDQLLRGGPPPDLPSPESMAQIVDVALSHIPS